MKTINVTFTDSEWRELTLRKGKDTWHDFILGKIEEGNMIKEIKKM